MECFRAGMCDPIRRDGRGVGRVAPITDRVMGAGAGVGFFETLRFFNVSKSKRCKILLPGGLGPLWEREREWELRERNGSRKHSRSYSRELWERTPLVSVRRNCTVLFVLFCSLYSTWYKTTCPPQTWGLTVFLFNPIWIGS